MLKPGKKVMAMLSRISGPIPERHGSTPRARCMTNAAAMRPKTAPDAPTVTESALSSSAPNDPESSDAK